MSTAAFDTTAQSLAEFAHGLTLAAVPAATQQRALHLMLDAVGCALAARQEDFALKLAPAIASLADTVGRRGVIGFGQRLPLRDVTWLNGVLMHGLDYDDTHMAGVVHLTVSVLPAVWSLAAERRASGAQMLLAYIAGVEAGARIASVVKGGLHTQGFHPTGVVGCLCQRRGGRQADRPERGATGGRAGHCAVAGQRQPAVPGRRRVDQAPAPRLGGAGGRAGRSAGRARHSRRRPNPTKAASACSAPTWARTCRPGPTSRLAAPAWVGCGSWSRSRSSPSPCVTSCMPLPTRPSPCMATGWLRPTSNASMP
jgi:hypothetical protein